MTFHCVPRWADSRRAVVRLGLVAMVGLSVAAFSALDYGETITARMWPDQPPVTTATEVTGPIWTSVTMPEEVIGGTTVTAADGYIMDGEEPSPFDETVPAIANLNPDLRDAVQQAAMDAEADGITFVINSGWRSATYQQALLDEAIVQYGSEAEARKWVQTPEESHHVTGDAVDIGPTDADYWLIEHGAEYGLCQTYANEVWHFELMVEPGGMCPEPIDDAASG